MICLILRILYKSYIYTFWYNFDTDLYPFLETGTSDRCLIVIVQRLRFSGFTPFHISFTVPFNHGNSLDQFGLQNIQSTNWSWESSFKFSRFFKKICGHPIRFGFQAKYVYEKNYITRDIIRHVFPFEPTKVTK